MSYCKDCPNWRYSEPFGHYCQLFDWKSKPDDFCSLENREPERPKDRPSGRWLAAWSGNDVEGYACSECDYFVPAEEVFDYDFCPSCGADMRGES